MIISLYLLIKDFCEFKESNEASTKLIEEVIIEDNNEETKEVYHTKPFGSDNKYISDKQLEAIFISDDELKNIKSSTPKEDNAVYLFMLKKESEGKLKKVAKVAGMNKFLRIYFARVKELY